MNVRNATAEDMDALVEMGEKFYATTSYAEFAEYDPKSIEFLVTLMLGSGVLLVAEHAGKLVGLVGLLVSGFMFNQSVKTAHEVIWWVDPDVRGSGAGTALLALIEPACREQGVQMIQMIHLTNSPPQAAALYERLGFSHSESSYSKVM